MANLSKFFSSLLPRRPVLPIRDPSLPPPSVGEITAVVRAALLDLGIPEARIAPDARLVKDLRADSDDLSFGFIPEVERKLGIEVPSRAWSEVYTVADVSKVLIAHRKS
jgi:acyl carrier protein